WRKRVDGCASEGKTAGRRGAGPPALWSRLGRASNADENHLAAVHDAGRDGRDGAIFQQFYGYLRTRVPFHKAPPNGQTVELWAVVPRWRSAGARRPRQRSAVAAGGQPARYSVAAVARQPAGRSAAAARHARWRAAAGAASRSAG